MAAVILEKIVGKIIVSGISKILWRILASSQGSRRLIILRFFGRPKKRNMIRRRLPCDEANWTFL